MPRKQQHEKELATSTRDGAPSALQSVARHVSRAPTFVSIYANDVQIHTSPWDMRIVLGEIGDTVEGNPPSINVHQLGEIRISPPLAKKLVQVIAEQVQAYERTFGPIPDIGIPEER